MTEGQLSCATCKWCRITQMRPTVDRDPHHDCTYRPPANMRRIPVLGINGELYAESGLNELGTTVQPDDWCSAWADRAVGEEQKHD